MKNQWHLNKGVSLANIVSIIGLCVAGTAAWYTLQGRVATAEVQVKANAEAIGKFDDLKLETVRLRGSVNNLNSTLIRLDETAKAELEFRRKWMQDKNVQDAKQDKDISYLKEK